MESEPDINKMVVEFIQSNIQTSIAIAQRTAKGASNLVKSKLERTYSVYLTRVLERYSKGKSFFVRSEPIPLYDYFVPLDLGTERRLLERPTAADLATVTSSYILTGSGGSGKTMMMRHLLISTIASGLKTPIFVELRQLAQRNDNLKAWLLHILQTNGLDVDADYFELALAAGHFSIMLDGFDELEHARRKPVAAEVQELAEKYPLNWFVVSSRADPELDRWETFTQFRVQPLRLETAVELVMKLPFDDSVKEKFTADLIAGLFVKHQSFLSNPLLLSIMLLTYSDVAHIPDKLSIYYNQAYESLFQKHDALKGGFQRERKSGLDIQDFERAFAAFCLQSYDKRQFAFPRQSALEYLDQGQAICQLKYNSEAVLHDALQAVCLLVEEGIQITFAHRSFQEYFVARFIAASNPEAKAQLIRRFAPTTASDSVMALLFELDAYSVERYYVLPVLDGLKKKLKLVKKIGITHYLRFLAILYARFDADRGHEGVTAQLADSAMWSAMRFIDQRYGWIAPSTEDWTAERRQLKDAFFLEYGDDESYVLPKKLTPRSQFTRALANAKGYWGMDYLKTVMEAEATIRGRHLDLQSSLDKILG